MREAVFNGAKCILTPLIIFFALTPPSARVKHLRVISLYSMCAAATAMLFSTSERRGADL